MKLTEYNLTHARKFLEVSTRMVVPFLIILTYYDLCDIYQKKLQYYTEKTHLSIACNASVSIFPYAVSVSVLHSY